MYESGESVVCVNDVFEPIHRKIYRQLPVKGVVYTVRDCSIGRTRTGSPDKAETYCVTLIEITNGPDPYMNPAVAEELSFRADRFAPVVEETEFERASNWKPEPAERDRELVPAGEPNWKGNRYEVETAMRKCLFRLIKAKKHGLAGVAAVERDILRSLRDRWEGL
jgi:hypothetical protein